MNKALLLLSGGQDSTTLAWWAKTQPYERIEALAFHYGQSHALELAFARQVARDLELELSMMELPTLSTGASHIVAHRNAVFLSLAVSYAIAHDLDHVIIGACLDDAAIFKDCSAAFIESFNAMLRAQGVRVEVIAPLVYRTKAQVFELAKELGALEYIIDQTHTCYAGARTHVYAWGRGCGECGACQLRARGWAAFSQGGDHAI